MYMLVCIMLYVYFFIIYVNPFCLYACLCICLYNRPFLSLTLVYHIYIYMSIMYMMLYIVLYKICITLPRICCFACMNDIFSVLIINLDN